MSVVLTVTKPKNADQRQRTQHGVAPSGPRTVATPSTPRHLAPVSPQRQLLRGRPGVNNRALNYADRLRTVERY